MSVPGRPEADSRTADAPDEDGQHPSPRLAGLFERIPTVDALRTPRTGGVVGFGVLHWLAFAALASGAFWLAGGTRIPLGSDTVLPAAVGLLSGYVLTTYLPRRGLRADLPSCALMGAIMAVVVPMFVAPGELFASVVGVALLTLYAVQRWTGMGACVP